MDVIRYIKGLKCSPHWREMDIIRINLILSNFSHFSLTLQFFIVNVELELDVTDQESGPQMADDKPIIQAFLESRTPEKDREKK
jgi:hypothetical protein